MSTRLESVALHHSLTAADGVTAVREEIGLSDVVRIVGTVNGHQRVWRFSGDEAVEEAAQFMRWRFGRVYDIKPLGDTLATARL